MGQPRGSASEQFNTPNGVAVDGNGNVFVADTGNRPTDPGNKRIE